jgi:hypothetical protein
MLVKQDMARAKNTLGSRVPEHIPSIAHVAKQETAL